MKNTQKIVLTLTLALLLASCSPAADPADDQTTPAAVTTAPSETTSAPDETTGSQSQNPVFTVGFEDSDFHFTVNGADLRPGSKLSSFSAQLGEPVEMTEAPSCYAEGNDKVIVYDGYTLYTTPDGDEDTLSIIELNGASVSTPKGAHVGMTFDEIKALYGESFSSEGITRVYYLDSGDSLCFTVETDNTVSLIEYVIG